MDLSLSHLSRKNPSMAASASLEFSGVSHTKALVAMLMLTLLFVLGMLVPSAATAAASSSSPPTEMDTSNAAEDPLAVMGREFESFINKFGKKYSSEEEKSKRFKIFMETFKDIEEFNRTKGPDCTYTLGINFFADLTQDEMASYRGLATRSNKAGRKTRGRKRD